MRGLRLVDRSLLSKQGLLLMKMHKYSAIFSLEFNFFESHIFQFNLKMR